MSRTDSSHAGADLRIGNPKSSAQFIEMLNDADAPLPWTADGNVLRDADGWPIGEISGPHAIVIAAMIEVAVNTCGSFRATRATDSD